MTTSVILLLWIAAESPLVLAQAAPEAVCEKLKGPLSVPRYPFLGRAGYGAEFEIRYEVTDGRVQAVEVLAAWMNRDGDRWRTGSSPEAEPASSFLGAVREALDQWQFADPIPCQGRVRILFTTRTDSSTFTEYRIERYPDSVPRHLTIELHRLIQIGGKPDRENP